MVLNPGTKFPFNIVTINKEYENTDCLVSVYVIEYVTKGKSLKIFQMKRKYLLFCLFRLPHPLSVLVVHQYSWLRGASKTSLGKIFFLLTHSGILNIS